MAQTTGVTRAEREGVQTARQQLEALFREHNAFVFRCVRRMGVSAAEAEELTQEAYLVAYRKLADYTEQGSARAWLGQIARNITLRYIRGRRREDRRIESSKGLFDRPSPEPDEQLARNEGAVLLEQFIATLPEAQREVFCLADVEGLKAPEIAEMLDVNLNTIYSRGRLAREKFHAFLTAQNTAGERKVGHGS